MLEVGYVARPHGLRGEVVVQLVTSLEDRLAQGSTLSTVEGRQLRVTEARPFGDRSPSGARGSRWLVRFDGVEDRNAAEGLSSTALLAEPVKGAEGLWVHELIGSAVFSLDGTAHGEVVSVEANPASDLLVLASGALVPLRFVVSAGEGRVVVDVPEGLFDL